MNYVNLIIIFLIFYYLYYTNNNYYNTNPFYKYIKKHNLKEITKYKQLYNICGNIYNHVKYAEYSFLDSVSLINKFLLMYSNLKTLEYDKHQILKLTTYKKEILMNFHTFNNTLPAKLLPDFEKKIQSLSNILNNIIDSLYPINDLNRPIYPIAWNEITDNFNPFI